MNNTSLKYNGMPKSKPPKSGKCCNPNKCWFRFQRIRISNVGDLKNSNTFSLGFYLLNQTKTKNVPKPNVFGFQTLSEYRNLWNWAKS